MNDKITYAQFLVQMAEARIFDEEEIEHQWNEYLSELQTA